MLTALLVLLHTGIMIDNNSIMLGDTDLVMTPFWEESIPTHRKVTWKSDRPDMCEHQRGQAVHCRMCCRSVVFTRSVFHLNAKDSWQGMLGSSTKKLTLSEEPLLVAIQLHHVHAAVHMRHVELLPALACMHSWTCMSLFYISSLLLLK